MITEDPWYMNYLVDMDHFLINGILSIRGTVSDEFSTSFGVYRPGGRYTFHAQFSFHSEKKITL